MIRFWIQEAHLGWLKGIAMTLAVSLLFTIVVPSYAEASIWTDRTKAVQKLREERKAGKELRYRQRRAMKQALKGKFGAPATGIEIPEEYDGALVDWVQALLLLRQRGYDGLGPILERHLGGAK